MSRSCRRRSNSESGLRRLDLMSQPPPHLKRPGVEGGDGPRRNRVANVESSHAPGEAS